MVAAGIGASGSDDVEGNGFADGTGVGELGKNVECMRSCNCDAACLSDASMSTARPLLLCGSVIFIFWYLFGGFDHF